MGAPHCKAVLGPKKIVPSKAGAKMTISRELQCLNVFFLFSNPEKTYPCAEPRRFDVLSVKIGSGALAVGRWKDPKNMPSKQTSLMRNFAHTGKRNPLRDPD